MASNITMTEASEPIGGAKQGVKIAVVLAFVLVLSAGMAFLGGRAIDEKRQVTLDNQEKRLRLLAHGRAQMVEAWLENLSQQGDRLIKSDLFRLYAAEVDSINGDLASIFGAIPGQDVDSGVPELAQQLPMMQNMLREFSAYAGFVNARILNREGDAYIATDGHLPPMLAEQVEQASEAIRTKSPRFSPLRKTGQGVELDVYVPIFPPDDTNGEQEPVGTLMITRQVSGQITELLSNSSLSAEGEKTRLMQRMGDVYREVTPWTASGFSDVMADISLNAENILPFAQRSSLSDDTHKVFSMAVPVNGPQWWIVQEAGAQGVLGPIENYSGTVYVVTGLGVLTAFLMAGLAWWVMAGVQSKRVAAEFKALALLIEDQKRFIDSINANIEEFITLKDAEGRYTYVNDAFAQAVGRSRDEIIGMDGVAVFGYDTAKRLSSMDDIVLMENRQVVVNESVFLRSQRYRFQIAKSPYCGADGTCIGIVEVYRDMTEFVAIQEKNRRLIRRAMEALGSTIEAADPYLGGHTKLLAGLSVEVARHMHLPETDVVEIETAANLSQIGKMFVPNEILTKPGKLTPEEKAIMENHVEHAYRILKDIDIAEGVLIAIYQMSEHVDGSGYPKKLTGNEIILPARILSSLNAFCAMIRPRSYRGAKSPEDALGILLQENTKYDQDVVYALGEVLKTPTGERVLREEL